MDNAHHTAAKSADDHRDHNDHHYGRWLLAGALLAAMGTAGLLSLVHAGDSPAAPQPAAAPAATAQRPAAGAAPDTSVPDAATALKHKTEEHTPATAPSF